MLSVLTAAIYNKLANDATLTALLATYRSNPAIFTADLIPEDALMPYVVLDNTWAQVDIGAKDNALDREISRDIRVYILRRYSIQQLEAIVERIRVLLHRVVLTVTGYTNIISIVKGPITAPREDHAIGAVLQVTHTLTT